MFTRISDIDRLFGTMNLLRNRLNNFYNEYDTTGTGYDRVIGASIPRTNLYEKGDSFEIRSEVPGLAREELNVRIQGNYLEISGSHNPDAPDGYKVHKMERGVTSFSRSFTLPSDVNAEKVEAVLKDGILYLTLPKAEAAKPKKITVN